MLVEIADKTKQEMRFQLRETSNFHALARDKVPIIYDTKYRGQMCYMEGISSMESYMVHLIIVNIERRINCLEHHGYKIR